MCCQAFQSRYMAQHGARVSRYAPSSPRSAKHSRHTATAVMRALEAIPVVIWSSSPVAYLQCTPRTS